MDDLETRIPMGDRIKETMRERGLRPSELAARVIEKAAAMGLPPPKPRSIYATLARGSKGSEWSGLIAEVLDVNHLWLQSGVGSKVAPRAWPFPDVDPVKVERLAESDRKLLERSILVTALLFSLDVAAAVVGDPSVVVACCVCMLVGDFARLWDVVGSAMHAAASGPRGVW